MNPTLHTSFFFFIHSHTIKNPVKNTLNHYRPPFIYI